MMKKQGSCILFLMVFFVISLAQVNAQRSNVSLGIVPTYKVNGYGISANFNYHHNPTDYFQLHLVVAFSEEQPNSAVAFPFENYLANLGYFTTVLSSKRRGISIFFGGGPAVGYEITKESNSQSSFMVEPATQIFVFGAFASFEVDFYLTDALSLVIPTTGIYHYNSAVEEIKLLLGLGLRWYFN